jgi:hypothetical protein
MGRMIAFADSGNNTATISWIRTGVPRPAGLEALFALERMVLRRGRPGGADAISREDLSAPRRDERDPYIVIDFTNAERDPASSARLHLRPLYNGKAGEDAALAAILAGDLPVIEIREEVSGAILDRGRPSAETAQGLSGALDAVMARTMTLLNAVLAGRPRWPQKTAGFDRGNPRSPASYVLTGMTGAITKMIYRLCCYAPHWHIGWRFTEDAGIWTLRDLSGTPFQILPDPGHRFFADPFAVNWQGRTFVFFEDLDHRVGKGTISAIEFNDAGPTGGVIPVLEERWHLSYPFMIEHAGALWMIPESSENREVALYRCIDFPNRWERHATLLSDLELGDATVVRHLGRYYLFGTTRDGGGGYSDTLSIFHAEDLFGPWLPHAGNPVMVNRSSARPAGNFVTINGQLWRPVQDCSNGYGAALGLAEIDELSPTSFRQTVRHTLRPGIRWPGRKLHTLNRSGRLEVIDGSRIQPKLDWPPARRNSSAAIR